MKRTKRLISVLVLVAVLFSLFPVSVLAKTTTKYSLTISAAASTADAMADIAKLYNKKYPNVTLTFNYGSSGSLQKQIEQGSPVDVFVSAATKQMNALKDEKLLYNSTIRTIAYNKVVLIVPSDSKLDLKKFTDLTGASVDIIALGEPTSVPAGQYGQEVLTYYKILDTVKKRAVYAKDVTEVLTWVERGNADAGIVYRTDAINSTKVKIVATAPSYAHTKVEYPAAVIRGSKHPKVANTFVKFLDTPDAQEVLDKYGFTFD
ncbi:MAG: modA1 [Herbinix sp.]|jgi:molybdate transport system substrate-binding protein|nr:modA1 [Herbinix sp.]